MNLEAIRKLIPEYTTSFVQSDRGREHLAWFPRGRQSGRANFDLVRARASQGDDVTELVLLKLLPHIDSPFNRERGAWVCIAPVVTRDIKQWFEGSKWADTDDWREIARLLLRFFETVTNNPAKLEAECRNFKESPYSKGFQSGFLSPMLNAIRPDAFRLVNSKTRDTLKGLAGVQSWTGLVDYPHANRLVQEITQSLQKDLPIIDTPGVLPADVFDAFCHWWVSIYEGDPKSDNGGQPKETKVGSPDDILRRFYATETVRHMACEVMADAVETAHHHSPACWEITVRTHKIRLNVGRAAAVDFKPGIIRVGLVPDDLPNALRDQLEGEGRWKNEFATKPITRLCQFEPESYLALRDKLTESRREFIRIAAATGLQTPFHRFHSPEMVELLESVVGRSLPKASFKAAPSKQQPERGEKLKMEPARRFDQRQSLFHKVDYTVGHLVNCVEMGEIGLPELQRPFVWNRSKVRDLFDSMFNGFPVGFLLLWSNTVGHAAKHIGAPNKQIRVPSQLVVDGQQRLTSLFAVFKGAAVTDDDYRESTIDIAFRPRDGKFEVADAAIIRDPEFIPNISALWNGVVGEFQFVKTFLEKLKQVRELATEDETIISNNISRLQNLVNYQLMALVVHADVDEELVADIFVRINNQGVKLEQADFILTLLSVFWPEGRKELEGFAKAAKIPPAALNQPSPFNHLLQPSADQMVRATIGVGFHRGRLKSVYQILRGRDPESGQFSLELRDAQFERLKAAQPKVLNLNDWHAFLQTIRAAGFVSSELISSTNSIIYTYSLYLIGKHQCGCKEPELGRLIRRWFVAVTLSARYSGSSETTMEGDLGDLRDLTTSDQFADTLERRIQTILTGDYWQVTVPADLETSSSSAPQMLAFRAAQIVLHAPVLFSDIKVRDLLDPLLRPAMKAVEHHHLFPKAWLKRQGVTSSKRINQVANLTYLEWPKNRDLSDLPPSEYIPRVKDDFEAGRWDYMHHMHALPPNWHTMEYEHFLEARRLLMADLIRQAYQSLSAVTADAAGLTLAEATPDERVVWQGIEQLEKAMRSLVTTEYQKKWGPAADNQIKAVLGAQAMELIERHREKHLDAYGGGKLPQAEARTLDYCYLGQLAQLMTANAAWECFKNRFADARQLQDLMKAVTTVRNDLAHFRRVPRKELLRCQLATEDLLERVGQGLTH